MLDETNTKPMEQANPQLPTQPTPSQAHKAAPPRNAGRIMQWVTVVLSVIALLLSIVANLRVSTIQNGTGNSASAPSSAGTSASSGSDAKAMKKTESKTVEYTATEGSVLEGDYAPYDSVNFHLKLVKLEVTGTKATLTSEVTNNGTDSDSTSFLTRAFQNGQQTGIGTIITDGQIQAGYTATVTTEFDVKDATQPISLEIELSYDQKLQIEYSPQN
ncbi:hypothetical protein [Bifidobacterium moukalabense]|uniref:DUF5067 domain-containing protein n=1 Tax=Bifidobacterium moukalabense DSM 27321 TaxID=1435051 RepID=W4NA84_9BIFI|nr:hypothetical protein [Bifidobacterium moukalabense]ETY72028.1 hypothetical protein BMOU_0029 [Bifidobacterium moukalabense DSM 27321]